MKPFIYSLGFAFVLLLASFTEAVAQTPTFDVRFTMKDTVCEAGKYQVLIEIKAKDDTSHFNLSDQNYRFSFNRDAVKPYDLNLPLADRSVQIDTQYLEGFVIKDGIFSFYDPHTLTGSIDTIVSYNVVLSGGDGYPLVDTEWLKVGCLGFDFIDPTACPRFKWHDTQPINFPPTFIGVKVGPGVLAQAEEGDYLNYNEDCSEFPCRIVPPLPIELLSFTAEEDDDCQISLNWTTITEINNDRFLLKHSYNGVNYRTIAEINGYGEGTSTTELNYSYVDENIGKNNYYRLDQVDLDGTTTSSEVELVKSRCFEGVVGISGLFPNPIVKGVEIVRLKLVSDIETADAEMVITDVLGKEIARKSISLVSGPNLFEYNTRKLAAGAYFVQIVGLDWYSSPRKFVKLD